MNGRKVLGRLILVFIGINLVLLAMNIMKDVGSYILSGEDIKAITSILEDRDIILDTTLPRVYTPKKKACIVLPESNLETRDNMVKKVLAASMDEITISSSAKSGTDQVTNRVYTKESQSVTFEGKQIIYKDLNVSLERSPMLLARAKEACRGFIKKAGLEKKFKQAYSESVVLENKIILIYYPKFEGIPVFNSYLEFTIGQDGIAQVIMQLADIQESKETQIKGAIYPVDIVLFGIDDDLQLKKPLRITSIVLGYCSLNTPGMDILEEEIVPAYKIEIDGLNTPLFVNAYTNTEIK